MAFSAFPLGIGIDHYTMSRFNQFDLRSNPPPVFPARFPYSKRNFANKPSAKPQMASFFAPIPQRRRPVTPLFEFLVIFGPPTSTAGVSPLSASVAKTGSPAITASTDDKSPIGLK